MNHSTMQVVYGTTTLLQKWARVKNNPRMVRQRCCLRWVVICDYVLHDYFRFSQQWLIVLALDNSSSYETYGYYFNHIHDHEERLHFGVCRPVYCLINGWKATRLLGKMWVFFQVSIATSMDPMQRVIQYCCTYLQHAKIIYLRYLSN